MVAPNTLSKETQGFGNAFDCMICWLVFENSAEQTKLRVKKTEKIIRLDVIGYRLHCFCGPMISVILMPKCSSSTTTSPFATGLLLTNRSTGASAGLSS